MRPRGSYGEIARALCAHAGTPVTVRQMATAACVGFSTAQYTASRLVSAGELVAVRRERPALLVRRDVAPEPAPSRGASLAEAMRLFWESDGDDS